MCEEKYMRVFYSVFKELGLSISEAIVYSYIKSFSSVGQYFYGGAGKVADTFNLSERTVYRILDKLSDEDLIFKTKEGFRATTKMERICMKNKKSHDEYRRKYLREEV